jgi:hypothetical protein
MNNDHNISNEDNDLNGMAPKLSKLSSNNPFNPSDSYFDSFTSKLQNRIDDEEEIKALAPTLLSIDKYNPFEVPKDYFEELPTIIQERVVETKEKSNLIDWLFWLLRPRLAVSMIVILFISILGVYYMNKNTVKNTEQTEELSLEDNLYYINETDILEHLTADASIENISTSEDDNSIEDYLLDNNIDESNLSNEL